MPGVRQSIFSNMEFGIANLLAYIFLFNNKALFAVASYQISGLLRVSPALGMKMFKKTNFYIISSRNTYLQGNAGKCIL